MIEQVIRPRSPQASVMMAKTFFLRHNAEQFFRHAHDVSKLARKCQVVETEHINNPNTDPKRALANSILLETILFHPINPHNLGGVQDLPPPLRDPLVLACMDSFHRTKMLDSRRADVDEYRDVIFDTNRKLKLSYYGVLADYAVTGKHEERLSELVGQGMHPMFRTFKDIDDAVLSYRNHAYAGLMLHGPSAERLGYQTLAADIFEHAISIEYPGIATHVTDSFPNQFIEERISATQGPARFLLAMIRDTLRAMGFDVDVHFRKKKPGKIMNKVRRRLETKFQATTLGNELFSADQCEPRCEFSEEYHNAFKAFAESHARTIDISAFTDLFAMRVVIHGYHGLDLDSEKTDLPTIERCIAMADRQISICIGSFNDYLIYRGKGFTYATSDGDEPQPSLSSEKKRTTNGYYANHFDLVPNFLTRFDIERTPLKMEVQLTSGFWQKFSENGQAAHAHHLGGNRKFVTLIDRGVDELIPSINGRSSNGRRNGNSHALVLPDASIMAEEPATYGSPST